MHDAKWQIRRGEVRLEDSAHLGWHEAAIGPTVHLCPEANGVAFGSQGHFAKCPVALFENKGFATGFNPLGISVENCLTSVGRRDTEALLLLRQDGARCQPHQVDRVGHPTGFVEVVNAPDEPALGIAPSAEVLYV